MTAIQKAILRALAHGPLNQFEIAETIDEAPFRVRAELQHLRRERITFDRHERAGHLWRLTDIGHGLLWDDAQMQLVKDRPAG